MSMGMVPEWRRTDYFDEPEGGFVSSEAFSEEELRRSFDALDDEGKQQMREYIENVRQATGHNDLWTPPAAQS